MLFNSIDFLIFLPVVVVFYYLLPHRLRWVLLLGASYLFYASWKVEYLLLIVASTLVDYYMGLKMGSLHDRKSRRPYLIISILANLGLLFYFKYFNFFAENVNQLLGAMDSPLVPMASVLLPVGISFYTFQTMSYSIDVYRGKQEAECHLGYFALYVTFFPQLVAGPIERFSRLTPQLKTFHRFTYENMALGGRLILFGLFVKMAVADNLGPFVDAVYAAPEDFKQADVWTAVFFYSFQIYGDFYGYSLIAMGSAKLMGIQLIDNFRTPYLSKSIVEFWTRWHISLTQWFRDYLYLPLGGNRVNNVKWLRNVLLVFLISGLWHGAHWTFVIWGALHGVFYLLEKWMNRLTFGYFQSNLHLWMQVFLVAKNFVLVSLIWIFFRSPDLDVVNRMFSTLFNDNPSISELLSVPGEVWALLSAFVLWEITLQEKDFSQMVGQWPISLRWSLYALLIFGVIAFAGIEDFPFIYFQF